MNDSTTVLNRMPWTSAAAPATLPPEPLLTREWLVSNGLGGYASGSVAGVCTRRYHGYLIAALTGKAGRVMMLNHLSELLRLPDGRVVQLGGEERADGSLELHATHGSLAEFQLEAGLPVWRYDLGGGYVVEKRLWMLHAQNTSHVNYRLISGEGTVRLKIRPSVQFRGHDERVSVDHPGRYVVTAVDERFEIAQQDTGLPALRLKLWGEHASFGLDCLRSTAIFYRVEAARGYDALGQLWSPGRLAANLRTGNQDVTLVASTENWDTILALQPHEARRAELERRRRLLLAAPVAAQSGVGAELVLAADQFIIRPAGRVEDTARAHASGDEVRTVIAGYHWFTDWGRDTMISLEGLTLCTGRYAEAGYILRTFGHYVRDGLIPNLFPEGNQQGLYHTADATLWFFHALQRYVDASGDRETLRMLLPKMRDIVAHHVKGTHFGIGVDPADGLLRQGQQGYQLTWMDAKVDDWVVTPRRGKAVEINALWYNALRLIEQWSREESAEDGSAEQYAQLAARVKQSFNARFWYEAGGYLYDVLDGESGDDAACRPNQVFSIALDHPVLDPARWPAVMSVVREKLLTPVGLRSLAPGHPDYKARYDGDLRSRDAAYHQGTVWAWLAGPFIDALLRVDPGARAEARKALEGFVPHLGEACIGSISEIFDAEAPYTPRGCVAQAWSVAEVLRCWLKTAE